MQTFFLSIILLQVEPVRTVYSLKLLKSLGSILSAGLTRHMYLLSQKYPRRRINKIIVKSLNVTQFFEEADQMPKPRVELNLFSKQLWLQRPNFFGRRFGEKFAHT